MKNTKNCNESFGFVTSHNRKKMEQLIVDALRTSFHHMCKDTDEQPPKVTTRFGIDEAMEIASETSPFHKWLRIENCPEKTIRSLVDKDIFDRESFQFLDDRMVNELNFHPSQKIVVTC